jgi:type III secretion protein T
MTLLFSWEQWLLSLSLALPRLLATLTMLPFFTTMALPGLLRTGVAVSLVMAVLPIVAGETAGMTIEGVRLFILVAKEALLGLFIGFAIGTIFWVIDAVGSYVDNQRGSAMASEADPLTGQETTTLGMLFTQAFTVYFLTSGAFLVMLGVLYRTYVMWPVTKFMPSLGTSGPVFWLDLFDRSLHLVVLLSAPLIVTMLLTEFALGLVSRFVPQLDVFFLAMPIKSAVAILMLVVYVPILFSDLMGFSGGSSGIWQTLRGALE